MDLQRVGRVGRYDVTNDQSRWNLNRLVSTNDLCELRRGVMECPPYRRIVNRFDVKPWHDDVKPRDI